MREMEEEIMKKILLTLTLASALIGGALAARHWASELLKPAPPATNRVFVVEATKSVTKEAQEEAFAATENGANALQRGDSLTVIPLTGDAATETPGKIFRQSIRGERKAFDADLRAAKTAIHAGLLKLKNETTAQPFTRTDLLGTLRLAAESREAEKNFSLAVLSDMIQDTAELKFMTHPQMKHEASARQLAAALMQGKANVWQGARVFLGQLRSEDLKKLDGNRRAAIRAFWLEFFRAGGAAEVVWATDGTGQLESFLQAGAHERGSE